jgi:2-phospho-L-lactate/phosphoenolpyruvate guanylyltransferase
MISALVPVKSLSAGKSRLAPVLKAKAREDLSIYMLRKVLEALSRSGGLDWIGVVTNDPKVRSLAQDWKAHPIWETDQVSENRSIAHGSRICRDLGAKSLLVIHADLPRVTAGDIETLLSIGGSEPRVVLCPSKEGTGTNALYRTPPEVIPARFGPNSFCRHRAEAEARKIPWESCSLPGISLDIDTPEDLRGLSLWPGRKPLIPGSKEPRFL